MTPFTWDFPYASQRMPVLAANVVAYIAPARRDRQVRVRC